MTPHFSFIALLGHLITRSPEFLVRVEGLEPPRLAALEPKSSVSTNFTTPASWFSLYVIERVSIQRSFYNRSRLIYRLFQSCKGHRVVFCKNYYEKLGYCLFFTEIFGVTRSCILKRSIWQNKSDIQGNVAFVRTMVQGDKLFKGVTLVIN